MSTRPRTDSWWDPAWRRVLGSTVVLFLVILAFLVGRVRAGADSGLAREKTRATQVAPPAAGSGVDPRSGTGSGSTDPNDPFGGTPTDPGTSGGTDDFGNAVPGTGGQDVAPPSTHVS